MKSDQLYRPLLLVVLVYAAVGVATAALAGAAPSVQVRNVWRWAAWLLSLVVFLGHIAYEHFQLRSTVQNAAMHVAGAVAIAVFGLAVVGPVRSHWGMADFWRGPVLSVVLWPILTGIPSFLLAYLAGSILERLAGRDTKEDL